MTTMEVVKFLGQGSYGSVDLVRFIQPDGTFFYCARKSSCCRKSDSLKKEIQILTKFRGHPGIVQCFGNKLLEKLSLDGHKICSMFVEYAAGGTLESLMDKHATRRLPDHLIRLFTRRIVAGLASVHGSGYIHCDLKPENILVFPNYTYKDGVRCLSYEVKITDFGLAREKKQKDSWWKPDRPFWGTPLYMSPESVNKGEIGEALDIWSLGCVVLAMYTGRSPWSYETREKLLVAFRMGYTPQIPVILPWDARSFLETCFARNPQDRSSALRLLLFHPFLTKQKITSDIPRGLPIVKGAKDHQELHRQTERKPPELRVRPTIPPGFERLTALRMLRKPFILKEDITLDVLRGLPTIHAADVLV